MKLQPQTKTANDNGKPQDLAAVVMALHAAFRALDAPAELLARVLMVEESRKESS